MYVLPAKFAYFQKSKKNSRNFTISLNFGQVEVPTQALNVLKIMGSNLMQLLCKLMPISLWHPKSQILFFSQNALGTRHLKGEKLIKVKNNLKHTFYPSSQSPDIQKTVKKV